MAGFLVGTTASTTRGRAGTGIGSDTMGVREASREVRSAEEVCSCEVASRLEEVRDDMSWAASSAEESRAVAGTGGRTT